MNAIEFVERMDKIAEERFGEFGYDTCSRFEKKLIIKQIIDETSASN